MPWIHFIIVGRLSVVKVGWRKRRGLGVVLLLLSELKVFLLSDHRDTIYTYRHQQLLVQRLGLDGHCNLFFLISISRVWRLILRSNLIHIHKMDFALLLHLSVFLFSQLLCKHVVGFFFEFWGSSVLITLLALCVLILIWFLYLLKRLTVLRSE